MCTYCPQEKRSWFVYQGSQYINHNINKNVESIVINFLLSFADAKLYFLQIQNPNAKECQIWAHSVSNLEGAVYTQTNGYLTPHPNNIKIKIKQK